MKTTHLVSFSKKTFNVKPQNPFDSFIYFYSDFSTTSILKIVKLNKLTHFNNPSLYCGSLTIIRLGKLYLFYIKQIHKYMNLIEILRRFIFN